MRLLADENVARQKVEALRARGLEIEYVESLGFAGQGVSDAAVLAIAIAQGRIVLTHNGKDFKRLHRADDGHFGILILPDDVRHALIAEAIAAFLPTVGDWRGRLLRLHRPPA